VLDLKLQARYADVDDTTNGSTLSAYRSSALQEKLFRQMLKLQHDRLAACSADAVGHATPTSDEVASFRQTQQEQAERAVKRAATAASTRLRTVLHEQGAVCVGSSQADSEAQPTFVQHEAQPLAKRKRAWHCFQHGVSVVMIRCFSFTLHVHHSAPACSLAHFACAQSATVHNETLQGTHTCLDLSAGSAHSGV
jgi:hypothetical protein